MTRRWQVSYLVKAFLANLNKLAVISSSILRYCDFWSNEGWWLRFAVLVMSRTDAATKKKKRSFDHMRLFPISPPCHYATLGNMKATNTRWNLIRLINLYNKRHRLRTSPRLSPHLKQFFFRNSHFVTFYATPISLDEEKPRVTHFHRPDNMLAFERCPVTSF